MGLFSTGMVVGFTSAVHTCAPSQKDPRVEVGPSRVNAVLFSVGVFRRVCTIFVFCLAALLLLPRLGTICAATSVLLGDQTVESKQDSDAAGSAEAFQTTASTSGTVGSLTV
jgi:hypothetical protein